MQLKHISHTRDIQRPSPWVSSQGVGVAAGFCSPALITSLWIEGGKQSLKCLWCFKSGINLKMSSFVHSYVYRGGNTEPVHVNSEAANMVR